MQAGECEREITPESSSSKLLCKGELRRKTSSWMVVAKEAEESVSLLGHLPQLTWPKDRRVAPA